MTAPRSPRTFSLARLLLAITLFCLLCGLAVNFPAECILTASLFIPTAVVCLTLVSFSRNRRTVLAASILGGLIAYIFFFTFPEMHMGPAPRTAWEAVTGVFLPIAIFPPLSALLFGGTALLFDSQT